MGFNDYIRIENYGVKSRNEVPERTIEVTTFDPKQKKKAKKQKRKERAADIASELAGDLIAGSLVVTVVAVPTLLVVNIIRTIKNW